MIGTTAFISRVVPFESNGKVHVLCCYLGALKFVHPTINSLESRDGKHCCLFPSLAVRIMKSQQDIHAQQIILLTSMLQHNYTTDMLIPHGPLRHCVKEGAGHHENMS